MAGSSPSKAEGHEEGRPFTILIVDDEPDTLASLSELFEDQPAPPLVLTAASGPEALDVLAGARVDLILTDYRMQPMNGLEFLIKAQEVAPTAARVMMTAYADVHVSVRAINEGRVSYFFLKPFEPGALLGVVRGILSERRKIEHRKKAFARGFEGVRRHGAAKAASSSKVNDV